MNSLKWFLFSTACALTLIPTVLAIAQKTSKSTPPVTQSPQSKQSTYGLNSRRDNNGILRTMYRVNYGPLAGDAEHIARTFLDRNKTQFSITNASSDLKTMMVQEGQRTKHVRFEQSYLGIPVYHSDIVISINEWNVVTYVSNNYKPSIVLTSVQPSLSGETAILSAKAHLNIKQIFPGKEKATLTIYAENDAPRLSYNVTLSSKDPSGSWEVLIDAQTGEIFQTRDLRMYHQAKNNTVFHTNKVTTNGTGYIYDPDPLTTAGVFYNTPGFTDNNNADSPELDGQRILKTLNDLFFDGTNYNLTGPYVNIIDWDLPAIPPVAASNPDSFRFHRSQSGFEDVNLYYHLDNSQRHIQSLGFLTIQNLPIAADPHGANGADNAFFDPNVNSLAFGDGGVDDAEDADVIWHEYGHAIQTATVPGFGGSGSGNEEGAMGEGFGDYWAGSYSRTVNPNFSRNFAFTWDAGFNGTTGSIWPGRPLNYPLNYPPNGVSSIEVHDAGRYWSSVLMLIWEDLGRDVSDRIILQSHFYLGTFATMIDNAEAILQADQDLYGGAHAAQIGARFAQRHFLPPPQFTHRQLHDTENLLGPYGLTATIVPGYFALDDNKIKILWSRDTLFADSVLLTPTANLYEYSGAIPGNGTVAQYRYYISIQDQIGIVTTYPSDAPGHFFTFYAGTDTVRPVVAHTPLNSQAKLLWPPIVTANASDNIGVDSVWVEYVLQPENLTGTFPLLPMNDSTYKAVFGLDSSQFVIGDSILYRVIAKDVATLGNTTFVPAINYNSFTISKIKILIGSQLSTSSKLLYNTLSAKSEYTVDSMRWNGLVSSAIIPKYDLLIITAGTSLTPNLSKRNDIVTRVQNGGRVWIEGGEVGSFFEKPEGSSGFDPNFRKYVLHDSAWISDAVTSNLNPTFPTHKIFTSPNIISSPIPFTTTNSGGDRDAMTLIPNDTEASSIATWSDEPLSAGIIIFTPQSSPTPASIFFPFALSSISNSAIAQKLIENTAAYFFPVSGTTDIREDHLTIPTGYALEQNYPNPFNPQTTIRFELPAASNVSLTVYDVLGREVISLMEGRKSAGSYEVDFNAMSVASGIYFYKLNASGLTPGSPSFIDVKKMLLLK